MFYKIFLGRIKDIIHQEFRYVLNVTERNIWWINQMIGCGIYICTSEILYTITFNTIFR